MEIIPHIVIGDYLILAMSQKSHNFLIKKISIPRSLLDTYKANPYQYEIFLNKFLNLLFFGTIIETTVLPPTNINISINPITKSYIYDIINFPNYDVLYDNYIIFHTKVRMDNTCIQYFINHDLPLLSDFFLNFKTSFNIIIMGEREIENCLEQQLFNIISIYKQLINLKNNNNVIDLTHDVLYSGNTDFDNFKYEMNIINKAKYNITFGFGGPLNICQAFSKTNICYVGSLNHFILDRYNIINNNIYRNISDFIDMIKKINVI